MDNLSTREHVERRFAGMKAVRKPFEQDWQEISELALPSRNPNLSMQKGQRNSRRSNRATHDSYGSRASNILKSGMKSGMSSSVMPWFKLALADKDLMEHQPVKEYLAAVELLVYDLLSSTNFYDMATINYAELGCFGVAASIMVPHPEYRAVTHSLTSGEYWCAADGGMRVDTLYRRTMMTVRNCMAQFDGNKLSKHVRAAYDKGNYEMLVPIMHAIEPNMHRDPNMLDDKNMAYRSLCWEEGSPDKSMMLSEKGFRDKPFWAPRWETRGSDVYSDSAPGFEALPDLRELQLTARQRARTKDQIVKPPMKAAVGLRGTQIRLDPGAINYVAGTDQGGLEPLLTTQYQAIGALREDQYEIRRDVGECFHTPLFKAISEMEGVQPRNELEMTLRNDEKFTQLGPVVDRVNIEMLEVVVDRAYSILEELGQLPPPPEELQGVNMRIEFVSMLAQAQRASANSAIERAARYVGFISGIFPDASIKFDAEQSIDEFTSGIGAPPKIIRSDEIVERMRAQQQQQQQQQQAAALAQPALQGAQAAELLSRTQTGSGGSALEQITGGAASG